MRFEKTPQRREQWRIGRPAPEFIGPDSGQVDEALRPTLGAKRCRKRGEGENNRVIWYPGCHSLERCERG